MQLRYQYRIYPGRDQRAALSRLFGCVRVVFNDALERTAPVKASNKLLGPPRARTAEGPYQRVPQSTDLSRELIAQAKKSPERERLDQVSAVPLQQALRDLDKAWKAHEDSKTGKRQGSKVGAPRFESRRDQRQSARFTANARWKITQAGKLSLPRIGDIKVIWSRDLPPAPSSVTVIKDAADRYFASFVVETDASEVLSETTPEVGIDLGPSHFAVLSDGTKVANPRFLRRAERKLKKAQRALSRKTRGSNNREKARRKVARAHARVADAPQDFHHQLSTHIIRIPTASVYHYFPDRYRVDAELLRHHAGELDALIGGALKASGTETLSEGVDAFIDLVRDYFRRNPSYIVLWFAGQHTVLDDLVLEFDRAQAERLWHFLRERGHILEDTPKLALELAFEIGSRLFGIAFRGSPDGDEATLAEARRVITAHLETYAPR